MLTARKANDENKVHIEENRWWRQLRFNQRLEYALQNEQMEKKLGDPILKPN